MRTAILNEIREMLIKQESYLHYVRGEGMVLIDGAPPEIVQLREKLRNGLQKTKSTDIARTAVGRFF